MQSLEAAGHQPGARSLAAASVSAFLFTDIVGSTVRWEQDAASMRLDVKRHDALVRTAIQARNGDVFKTVGDAFCAVFKSVHDAVDAARDAQQILAAEEFHSEGGLRVRMAVHAGDAEERDNDYFGPTLNRVARLLSIGHGGQVLLSAAAAEQLRGARTLRDLGRHRLKDLTAPEHVFELEIADLPNDFPPLRSLTVLENNLPQQTTSFVGREDVIEQLETLLQQGRLVSLCGAGGVGKTRCALQVGADCVERFADGVWFADLAALSDASLVAATVARLFDLQETPTQPAIGALTGHLRGKALLLILDNCEHVIGEVAALAAALLKSCPDVRLLCTSREALNTAGERVLRLPSLAVDDALLLLQQRAQAVNPSFAVTDANARVLREVCARLDGIPLAIELAAARLRSMSPEQLARKLDERFRVLTGGDRAALPRQQTMRALIDWSYDLLPEHERVVFRRLSVFAGGFTAAALTGLCVSEELDEIELLDSLVSLADKSLALAEPCDDSMRYRLLESTRDYAREKLAEAGETAELRARHAGVYAGFAEGLDAICEDTAPKVWLAQAEREIENLRSALTWALSPDGDPEIGQRVAVTLPRIFGVLAPAEGLRWVSAALERVTENTPILMVAGLELAHASFASIFNQFTTALAAGQRAVNAFMQLQQAAGMADAQRLVGRSLLYLGRVDEGEDLLKASLAARQAAGSRRVAGILGDLAVARALKGDLHGARGLFARASALFEQEADISKIAITAATLAEAEFMAGNAQAALHLAGEALSAARGAGRHRTVAAILGNMAAYSLHLDECENALAHAREALEICRDVQPDVVSLLFAVQHLAAAAVLQPYADPAAAAVNLARAAHLLGFVDERLAVLQIPREHTERTTYDRAMQRLRETFDAQELGAVLVGGKAWTEERAIAQAAIL